MTHTPRERKVLPLFDVKAVEDGNQGIVDAIVSVFGNIDDGHDIVHPGSFTKTIAERMSRIRVLDQHNAGSIDRVLGKPLEIREVSRAELPEDVLRDFPRATGGLFTRTRYNLETQAGREAFVRIRDGDIGEYSFAFDILDRDYSEELDDRGQKVRVRNIRTVRLWEYGPVIWGMNPATATVAAKSDDPEPVDSDPSDGSDDHQQPDSSDSDQKELGPDGRRIRRLGDTVHAQLLRTYKDSILTHYSSGLVDTAEFQLLLSTGVAQLQLFRAAIPEDLSLRPTTSSVGPVWDDFFSLDPSLDDEKAGRVLSESNASRIKAAVDSLVSVLTDAGVLGPREESLSSDPPKTVSQSIEDVESKRQQLLQRLTRDGRAEGSPTTQQDISIGL